MDQKATTRLNTAFDAYLKNPSAAQQVLQAASHGAQTGLAGLAAAAAQQAGKEDALAQAGAQRQGATPTVIQQLAGQPGIMGQLPANIALAQAPTGAPPMAPQGMAGGGLVAFADGGLVLPPDVIEAIQSHFASGGDVRGFADGEGVDAAPHLIPSSWTDAIKGLLSPEAGRGRDVVEAERLAKEDLARRTPPSGILTALQNAVSPSPGNRPAMQSEPPIETPSNTSLLRPEDFAPSDMYKPNVDDQGKKIPVPAIKTVVSSPEGHPTVAKPDMPQEGQKVDTTFQVGAQDTHSAPATQQGLGALQPIDPYEARDKIADLLGHQTMSPELMQRMQDMQSDAKTSTIFQSLLGALGGGLSSPWGGRLAMGKAMLGGLAGYEKGASAEDDLNKQMFSVLKGYADAPAMEQAAAGKQVLEAAADKAKLEQAERIAHIKGSQGLSTDEWMARKAYAHSLGPTEYQQTQQSLLQEQRRANNINSARTQYEKWLTSSDGITATAQRKAEEQQKIYTALGVGDVLGGSPNINPNATIQSGPMGGQGPLIVRRATQ